MKEFNICNSWATIMGFSPCTFDGRLLPSLPVQASIITINKTPVQKSDYYHALIVLFPELILMPLLTGFSNAKRSFVLCLV